MTGVTLRELLERNDRHAASLDDDYFGEVQDAQHPAAVSVCCSDSRVSQEGMWDVDEPGWLFTPSTIGNMVWDRHGDELVLDDSFGYPLAHTGTEVAVVVGHTGCGAVTGALEAVRADDPTDIAKWLELLAPVVEAGLADERVDPEREVALVNQLVEYNVDRQIAYLLGSDDVPDDVDCYGFVYDFQCVYGDVPGRTYLVNVDGETDPSALKKAVGDEFEDHVRRLL